MAKLSQQLDRQQPTRTQRVFEKQQRKREVEEFTKLKNEAEGIKQGQFSEVKSIDEYEEKYNLLDPKLKQFFTTPIQLRQDKEQRINTTKTSIQLEIERKQQEYENQKNKIEAKIKKYEKEKEEETDKDRRRKYDRKIDDYEDRLDEKRAYYSNYLKGLNEGLGKLNSGQEINERDIKNYADDLGDYYEDREEARNEQRKFEKKRDQEIKDLEEQGYKPQLIQEFYKGQLKSEKVSYYNPQLQKFADLSVPLSSNIKNVSKLEKSTLGKTEVKRKISLGSKEYEFKTTAQLYKTPSGKLTTQLGGTTEKTEKEIISNSKEKSYQDILKEYQKVEIKADKSASSSKDDNRKWYDKSLQELFIQPAKSKVSSGFSYLGSKARQGLNIADEYVRYEPKIVGSPAFPIVSFVSFGKKKKEEKSFAEAVEFKQEDFGKTASKINEEAIESQLGSEKYGKFKTEKETKFKEDTTSLFYRSDIGKKAYFEAETDEELQEAFKDYTETQEYKQYSKQYSKQYDTELSEKLGEAPYSKKINNIGRGLQITGLNLAQLGLETVKTPTRTVLTAGSVIGGSYALGSLPTSTAVSLDVAFGTAGAVQTFAPSSTIEERGSGLIMLGFSTSSLGLKGYKYLKQPTIKYEPIKSPKINVKASEVIGKDVNVITKDGTINKVVFQEQKLAEGGIGGRRTIVSTRIRDFLKLDPIYQGVPYAQKGEQVILKSLRGTTTTIRKPSAYQKASKLLINSGYSEKEARGILRYYSPRTYETILSDGILNIKGTSATGQINYLRKQPSIIIDEELGIKTRGARTVKTVYDVERKIVGNAGEKGIGAVFEKKTEVSYLLKKNMLPDIKEFQYSEGLTFGKSSETLQGLEPIKSDIKGLKLYKEVEYQDLIGFNFQKNILPSDKFIGVGGSRTKLIKQIIDLTKEDNFVKPANIKKTPLSRTFGFDDTKITEVKNIIKDSAGNTGTKTTQVTGTQADTITKQILKQSVAPPKVSLKTQIKELTKMDTQPLKVKYGTKVKIGTEASLLSKGSLKTDQRIANLLKSNISFKDLIKTDTLVKQAVKLKTAQRTSPKLAQKSLSKELGFSVTNPRIFQTPKTPTPTNFIIPPMPVFFPSARGLDKKKRKSKSLQEYSYLPDFTSRVLGLEAQKISQTQAVKRLKKIMTGFEIRRPVKLGN